MTLTHGSLFAGIGGFDLGFERAGIKTIWQVEIESYCRRVLAHHFPSAKRYRDIRECGKHNLAPVDILSGGFPCQDISNAGKRAGIDGERSGLWSEYARIIRELRPPYVVVENVAALLGRGMERVLGDLAACGYDAEWQSIRASDVGAPHRRERIWIVAHPQRNGSSQPTRSTQFQRPILVETRWKEAPNRSWFGSKGEDVAYPNGRRCEQRHTGERGLSITDSLSNVSDANAERCGWGQNNQGQESAKRNGLALSSWWDTEPDVGRVAHGVPAFLDRLDLEDCLRVLYMYAISTNVDTAEALRMVRETYGEAEVFQWGTGGSDHVRTQEILFPFLRRIEKVCEEKHNAQESAQVPGCSVRGVPDYEKIAGPSFGPELAEQLSKQSPDSLQVLSRFLARYCSTAWSENRRSYAADRVGRLRGLGNAIVPQIAEWIGRRIVLDYDETK